MQTGNDFTGNLDKLSGLVTIVSVHENWVVFTWSDKRFSGIAKIYGEDSDFGIDGGRMSKLALYHGAPIGKPLANYDRGWDVEPTNTEVVLMTRELVAALR